MSGYGYDNSECSHVNQGPYVYRPLDRPSTGGNARALSPSDETRAVGPVFKAVSATELELQRLHERVEQLERRLVGVLAPPVPPSPSSGANGSPPSGAVSETTERVARIGLGIHAAHERVQGLIDRLEV